MNLDSLKNLASELPKGYKESATSLINRMEEVIEGIGDEPIRWKPGMLRLVQGTTDRSSIPKGTAIGDMLVGETKIEQPLKFIPLRMWTGRQYWDPDPNESRLICSSPDGKMGFTFGDCSTCPHAVFNEETRRSDCGKTKNAMVILSDLSEIFIITFAKTNYRVGMDLESLLKKAAVSPYRRAYGLSTTTNANYKNVENYALEILGPNDRVVDEALVPFLSELFTIVGEDRKEALAKFYEHVTAKLEAAKRAALEAPSTDAADAVIEIPANGEAKVGAMSAEPEVSDMAKNYIV